MSRVITDLTNKELDIFHALKENQLYRINEPKPGLFIAESPTVIERALAAGYEPVSFLIEKEQLNDRLEAMLAPYSDLPQYICDFSELSKITGYHVSRGFLAAFRCKDHNNVKEVCANKKRIVVLENVMNPTNVGAIIRSAAALSIEAVLLTKGCANPLQRRATRVSMGNVFSLPWAFMDTNITDINMLKELGFTCVAMALSDDAIFLDKYQPNKDEKLAIIMGTEGDGLSESTINSSDVVVKIPMSGNVDSLNVAAASAVAFWALR